MGPRVIAYYSIFIGFTILIFWINVLTQGQISEGKTEITFHLLSEFLMAVICLISGILLLKNSPGAMMLNILGLGMVIYSVLNAAGYYGERGNTIMMLMFSLLFILTSIAVFLSMKEMKLSHKE
jgi:hypothetical protein